jgi:eukaryotic-like serine/threonine-protein kinase
MQLSAPQRVRMDALLDELLDLPEESRLEQLQRSGEIDPAIIAEVESLLRASRAAGEFLCEPPSRSAPDPAEEISNGTRLGAWRILRLIGRGGMGDVYEAARALGDYEQRVAIKLLQRESGTQLQRFQVERQILARLEHPGIARLHDGGVTADGRPYMVMEFVAGCSITEFCTRTGASLHQRLQLFMQVCDAVACAHRNLIVHRDLKPSNILVTADGEVKLLDFGIAKLMDAQQAQLTVAAATFLTPSCAAPEQLTGAPLTTATDVYALGLLLFELLTGAHPWVGPDIPMMQAMRSVLQRPAPMASRTAEQRRGPIAARLIRGDLDAIVAKALRAEPTHRYATVAALKLDVERVLRGEPVEARAGARLYVFGRMLRQFRWAVAAVAAIVITLTCSLGFASWQAQRAAVERDAARRDAAREEAVRYNLTSMFRSAIANRGQQPATAKSMIDDSAQRVLREYRDKPQLAGQIVLTLADLYGALEDATGAGTLLEGFVAEAGPDADPAALADAREKLANIELIRGHTDRAAQLLDQAEEYWKRAPQSNMEDRLEGLGVRAKLQRTRGDVDGAIATGREAIAQRIALSGHDHRETAILYNSLAISLISANRLDEALAAYRETTSIYQSLGLGDGLDAQIILANTGTLELRIGDLRNAEVLLANAIERQRALAGDSAAVAAAMGYYGRLLTITNRPQPAIDQLRQGVALADRYAGPGSPVALLNRLFLGEAQFAAGDNAGASATLLAAHDSALAQYGPAHPLTLRTQLALDQVKAAAGLYAEAQTQLLEAIGVLRKLGPSGEATLAQALETLGDVQLHEKRTQDAVASLSESVALREKSHNKNWELAEAQERLGEALAASGNGSAAALLKQAAQEFEAQLGVNHPQTLRAKAALARPAT